MMHKYIVGTAQRYVRFRARQCTEISGSHGDEDALDVLTGCDAAWTKRWTPTFRRKILPPSFWLTCPEDGRRMFLRNGGIT
jgi:hypothetical protein